MVMSNQTQGDLIANSTQLLELRSLYQIPGFQFVFPEPPLRGVFDIVDVLENDGIQQDVLVVSVNYKGESKEVSLMGGKGFVNNPNLVVAPTKVNGCSSILTDLADGPSPTKISSPKSSIAG